MTNPVCAGFSYCFLLQASIFDHPPSIDISIFTFGKSPTTYFSAPHKSFCVAFLSTKASWPRENVMAGTILYRDSAHAHLSSLDYGPPAVWYGFNFFHVIVPTLLLICYGITCIVYRIRRRSLPKMAAAGNAGIPGGLSWAVVFDIHYDSTIFWMTVSTVSGIQTLKGHQISFDIYMPSCSHITLPEISFRKFHSLVKNPWIQTGSAWKLGM